MEYLNKIFLLENVFRVINIVIIQLFDANKTKELERPHTQIALHITCWKISLTQFKSTILSQKTEGEKERKKEKYPNWKVNNFIQLILISILYAKSKFGWVVFAHIHGVSAWQKKNHPKGHSLKWKFRPVRERASERARAPIKCNIKWCLLMLFHFGVTLVLSFSNCRHFSSSFAFTYICKKIVEIENGQRQSYKLFIYAYCNRIVWT